MLQSIEDIVSEFSSKSIYDALNNDDTSAAVMKILDRLKNSVERSGKLCRKCYETSESFRSLGNKSFELMKYGDAFKFYNKALLAAPINTKAMALALSNRTAVLVHCKQYSEALKDIEKCLKMDCLNVNTKRKLQDRKEKCLKLLPHNPEKSCTIGQLNVLEMNSKSHAEIPGVSEFVNVDMGCTFPMITAARDIHPGTVISVETGFVTIPDRYLTDLSCYYCQKYSLNLIPCENCCVALFCDDICKKKCLQEYHHVECKLANREYENTMALGLKALIKIRNMCSDWNEFIQISDNMGKTSIKKMNVYNTFSSNSKLSLLTKTFKGGKVYGRQFRFAWWTAIILLHLSDLTSFFPISVKERQEAFRAAAKVMMFLFLHTRRVDLGVIIFEISHDELHNYAAQSGYFSFLGKLKHSCDPNLQPVSVGNKMVLMALRPIKSGDELTVSYIDHYLQESNNTMERPFNLYLNMVPFCDCHVCTENLSVKNLKDEFPVNMSTFAKSLDEARGDPKNFYKMVVDNLAKLDHLRYTKLYYKLVYQPFQYVVGNNQYCQTKNKLLEKIYHIKIV